MAAGDLTNIRTPPADLVAEQSTLGAVLIRPSALIEIADLLEVDDFFFPAHREVYEAMLRVEARGSGMDVVGLADELRAGGMINRLDGGEGYLLTLSNSVPIAENVLHYARIVREKATARRLIAICGEAMARAYALEPIDEVLEEYTAALTRLDTRVDDVPVRMGDNLEQAMRVVERRVKNPAQFFVRTGVRAFDRRIGGYAREQLVIVAAQPGGGKSSWALGTAIRSTMDQGVPNLIFSLEMGLQEITERGVGAVSLVDTRNIHRGNLSTDDWGKIWPAQKAITPLPLYVYDQPCGIDKICAVARRWAAQVRRNLPPAADGLPALLLVTVDYIQIIDREHRRGGSEADALALISRSLKRLAKTLKCPVVALSQLTRESQKDRDIDGKPRKPRIQDLKGSGALESDADLVIFPFPHDPPEPRPGEEPELAWHADIIVGKNRAGAIGEIGATWDRRVMSFRDEQTEVDMEDSRLPRDDERV